MENMFFPGKKDIVGWWEEEIGKQGFSRWVENVVVALMPGPLKYDDKVRQALIDVFEGDNMDWYRGTIANWNDFMRKRGVPTSSPTQYEYQESLQFTAKDARRLFRKNGMAVMLNGKVSGVGYTTGYYFMDLIAPKWRAVIRQGFLRAAAFGNSVTQDNIGDINGNFCKWNQMEFRRYLRSRFSTAQIRKMCRGSLEDMDFRKYLHELVKRLKRKNQMEPCLLEDVICREWIRFQYLANLSVWGEIVRDCKAEGLRWRRFPPAVWGNQCRHATVGMTPYQVAQSRLVDVVWLEVAMHQPFVLPVAGCRVSVSAPYTCSTLSYKVGRASGEYRKPVWVVQWPLKAPNSGCLCGQISIAEAAAQGGIAYPPISFEKKVRGGPGYLRLQTFLARWRALFTHRDAYARVALVYPMSSLYWRNYNQLKPENYLLDRYMGSFAHALEDTHIQYEVIVFGHPDLWDDRKTFERLEKYDVILLPAVDCMTASQMKALAAFLKRGGTVVACGPTGKRDENFRVCKNAVCLDKFDNYITIPERIMSAYIPTYEKSCYDKPEDLRKKSVGYDVRPLREIMYKLLAEHNVLRTSAPDTTWVSSWLQERGQRLSVHLVNYDLVVDRKEFHKLTQVKDKGNRENELALKKPGYANIRVVRNLHLKVRVPSTLKFDRVRLIPVDGKPAELKYKKCEGKWVEVTIPQLHMWAIVVFTNADELETSCEIARARRAIDRIVVASEKVAPPGVRKMVKSAEKALSQRDFPKARKLAQNAKLRGEEMLGKVTESLTADERKRMEDDLELARGAAVALDFGAGTPAPGWKRLSPETMYNPKTGFGWEDNPSAKAAGTRKPDVMHGTNLSGQGEARLCVGLPDGKYEITVIGAEGSTSGEGGRNWVGVGDCWRLLGERVAPGTFSRRSFLTQVTDGHLILRMYGTAQCSDHAGAYHEMPDWRISGIAIRGAGSKPMLLSDLEAGAIRDWMLLGPFDDSGCRGMDERYPREFNPRSRSTHYDGDRLRKWQEWNANGEIGFAPVMLHEVIKPGNAIAYAATRVFSPAEKKAKLWFGSTGMAVVWLNGKTVVHDKAASGLNADEFEVDVKLKKGWNEVLVRVCAWWGDRWMFSASLTQPSGRAIRGLRFG